MLKSYSRLVLKFSLEGGCTMNYRIEEKGEIILTGYKRRFEGVPGEREEQEKDMYVTTRPWQYILGALAGDIETEYNVIANIDAMYINTLLGCTLGDIIFSIS
jgi:AraC family transcriptional regulator